MSYQKSAAHKKSLEYARSVAVKTKGNCQYCGEEFTACGVKNHEKYCWKNPENYKECPICSGPIKVIKNTTCSKACSNKLYPRRPPSEHYRNICFRHRDKKCVVCGESRIVEVHHLDENHLNNSWKNLIPLCPTHHQYWHSSYKHLVVGIIQDYLKNYE